ncbi:hypothetical protein NDU88_006341 [Pleurodeles waltl]|uniref:Uncharacterized protein n=1 Tax=Pleurodeles waltl TaxID=8319 RepID=A0AAV7WXY9_PLEWA|nr:hypothetical protein NDU88_006341 [Pleurodeles waltl]
MNQGTEETREECFSVSLATTRARRAAHGSVVSLATRARGRLVTPTVFRLRVTPQRLIKKKNDEGHNLMSTKVTGRIDNVLRNPSWTRPLGNPTWTLVTSRWSHRT